MKIKSYILCGLAITVFGILALISTEIQGSSANKIHNNLMVMGYIQNFESVSGGDYVKISHDGTDPFFETDDGTFNFLSVETENKNTWLTVDGNGTGYGVLRSWGPSNAEQLYLHHDGTDSLFFTTAGNFVFDSMVRQASIWHAYGGFEDQAETVVCGAGDWNHITNGGTNLWNLDENDAITISGDVLTLTNTGDYMGSWSLSISAINGKDFHVRIYNNTQTAACGRPIGISTTGAGNEMNVAVPVYIEGTAADAIQFEIMSADGTDPVVDDGLFVFTYLHD